MVKAERENREEHVLASMHLKLARVLAAAKKWSEAVRETIHAQDVDKSAFGSYYLRARYQEMQGETDAEIATRREAEAMAAKIGSTWGSASDRPTDPRAVMLSDIGRDEITAETDYAPITFADEVIAFLEPKLTALAPLEQAVLADAYFAAGRTDKYKQIWQQLFATREFDTAKAHGIFAANLLKKNDTAAAIPHLRRAYELDPENLTYRRRFEQTRKKVKTQAGKSK